MADNTYLTEYEKNANEESSERKELKPLSYKQVKENMPSIIRGAGQIIQGDLNVDTENFVKANLNFLDDIVKEMTPPPPPPPPNDGTEQPPQKEKTYADDKKKAEEMKEDKKKKSKDDREPDF